ncbi:MAG: hypothetical protein M3O62_12010 [Pseudomonadota bacterium]|nr:hypothetical protein [Pseudomonadota bacterium]
MRIPMAVLFRDLLLIASSVGLLLLSHQLASAASAWHVPVALLAGVMLAVTGYLLHEWGHLLGALFSRSVVHLPDSIATVFLFRFDTGLNTNRQFLWMSIGGFIASGVVVYIYATQLSLDQLADQTALVLTALGVLATIIFEFPPAWRVLRGGEMPGGVAFVKGVSEEA